MRYVWDLDNTLVMTREANLAAYREIGVTPPEDFHVRPWQEWCSHEDHEKKNSIVKRHLLEHVRPSPLFNMWTTLGGPILTNSSSSVLMALFKIFPPLEKAEFILATPEEKPRWLQRLEVTGVYIDDSPRTIQLVKEKTSWHPVLVSF